MALGPHLRGDERNESFYIGYANGGWRTAARRRLPPAGELTRKAVEQIERQVESAGEARRIRGPLLETSAIA